MKAILYTKYGSPDVLELKDIEKPVPGEMEALVKIYAVSINDWDLGLLKGIPFVNRLINGLLKPKRRILGSDIAGRIEAVGKNVKKFQPGDEVFGDLSNNWGGFAEYVCVNEKALALKSKDMTYEQAAAIPQAGMLAVQGLVDGGRLKHTKKLLINGAGGGVGTFGVQIAKLFDAEITGVDNSGKIEFMRSLGFDHVIDYTKEDFTKNGKRYDFILDVKTNRSVFSYLRALNRDGYYVTVGGSTFRLLQTFIFAPFIKMFNKKNFKVVALKPNKDLEYMKKLFEAGKVVPVIDGTYKLEDIPNALQYFNKGEHKGKIVITIKNEKN